MDVEKVIEELKKTKMTGFLTIANTGNAELDSAYKMLGDSIDLAIQTIRELQEQNKWHLVKDGDLPSEISKYVLVKLKNGGVMYAVWSGVSKCFKSVCEYGVYGFYKDNPVIAWRELPKFEGVE